jgi:hypothetical protein
MKEASSEDLCQGPRENLHRLVEEACNENGIGAMPMRELLKHEMSYCLGVAQNTFTIERALDIWVDNFRKNLSTTPKCGPDWMEIRRSGMPALVVGAGPSAKEADYKFLEGWPNIVIFCTNKSLSYLLRDGIEPDYVMVLHSTDEIKGTILTPEVAKYMEETQTGRIYSRFIIPSTIDSEVLKEIRCVGMEEKELWFNPAIPEESASNIDTFMSRMNGLRIIDTGGNVGVFAMNMAMEMSEGDIGMIGLEHCLPLSDQWTNKQSRTYRIEYAPENGGMLYAVPPSFQSYLETLVGLCRRKGEGRVTNLTSFGPVYTRKLLPYMTLRDFICQQRT